MQPIWWEVVGVPGQGRRQTLRLKVDVQRAEGPPQRTAAGQLDDARAEHQLEEEPPGGPEEEAGVGGEAPSDGGERREDAHLEEEGVPLEGGEGLADGGQRAVEKVEHQVVGRHAKDGEEELQRGEKGPEEGHQLQGAGQAEVEAAREEPDNRRAAVTAGVQLLGGDGLILLGGKRGDQVAKWEDALVAVEA